MLQQGWGYSGKLYDVILIKDVKNLKLNLLSCTQREFRFALCLFVLKYLESLIKPVNVKAKLLKFCFRPFFSLCPILVLVSPNVNLAF